MLVIKVVNHRVVQIGLTAESGYFSLSARKRGNLHSNLITRSLVQSTRQDQKVTTSNKQQHQLIPIARNISFRECRQSKGKTLANAKLMFNNAAASHYTSAHLLEEPLDGQVESPLELIKRRAKDVVDQSRVKWPTTSSNYYRQSFNETLAHTTNQRRLVVLLSWLEAKEKHIEKYRQFYLDRGFDVLNVKTSPLDLLLPSRGAMKIAKDFVRFMVEKQYSDVLLHGFSVGGFMFGQFLIEIDKQDESVKRNLLDSIQGLVFDSLVPLEGTCIGVANSITNNKMLAKLLENLLRLYLVAGRNIATKYYLQASDKVWGGPLRCPSLFLMSRDDRISDHRIVTHLADVWQNLGIETHRRLFDSSPHVQIFQKHHNAYVQEVENFLDRINMSKVESSKQ